MSAGNAPGAGDLDDFLEGLQEKMDEEALRLYGQDGYKRWRQGVNFARMQAPSCQSKVKGSCGDTIEMFFKVHNDRVVEASFFTDGCGSSMVCGSVAADLCRGATLDEAADIDPRRILSLLGDLPEHDQHCATLAAAAAREAVHAWMIKKTTP